MNSDGARMTESLDHLLLAASRTGVRNKRYFEALDEQTKNIVTLWSLSAVVPRSGLGEYLRSEPKWLVTYAAQAIRSLGEEKAAHAFETTQKAKGYERGSVLEIQEPHVALFVQSLRERVLEVAAKFAALETEAARAQALETEYQAELSAKSDKKATADKLAWDKVRESATPYSRDQHYDVGAILSHVKFGLGKVQALPPLSKDTIEVRFEEHGVRVLGHRA